MNKEKVIIVNRMIDMKRRLDTFEGDVSKRLIAAYTDARSGVLNQITRYTGQHKPNKKRLQVLLVEIESTLVELSTDLTKTVVNSTAHSGVYSYKAMNDIVSWDNRTLGFNNVALSFPQIQALVTAEFLGGKTIKGWIDSALKDISAEIQSGLIRGIGYKKLAREMSERISDNMDTVKAKRDLDTINKTYIQSINAKAQMDVYNANSDMVNLVEWSAIMENGNAATGRGTCPRCMALDGMTWDLDDLARPDMPLHPRCRCMWLPVTPTWKELGFDIDEMNTKYQKWYDRETDRGILAYGITDKNFAGWWATRGKKWQDTAIGPVRAEMIRNGEIEFVDMVNSLTGDLYTIDELLK